MTTSGPDMDSFNFNNITDTTTGAADPGGWINVLIKAHGILMILAWMVFASFAVLLPKYYKQAWPKFNLAGKPIWFQLHRKLMILVLLMTVTAFVIIFVEAGDYSDFPPPDNAHPPFGIIVMILTILNPIMAAFRCEPNAAKRPIFNVFHSIVGYMAHFAAVVAILLAMFMGFPDWCTWVFVAFICWHIFIEIVLKVHQHCLLAYQVRSEDYEVNGSTAGPVSKGQSSSTLNTAFMTSVLILHLVGVLGLAIAICIQIGQQS